MFIGGCAGSTGGAIKVVRFLIGRALRREIETDAAPGAREADPRQRRPSSRSGAPRGLAFILLYVRSSRSARRVLAIDAARPGPELSAFDAVAAAATTIGNVGPGFGFAGPMGSFAPFCDVSTIDDDRAHVDRPAGAHPGRRAADPRVLAGLSCRASGPETMLQPKRFRPRSGATSRQASRSLLQR